jgi:tyrosyl-tRNA synthetase
VVLWHDRAVPTLAEDLAFRGLIHQMSDTELTTRLERPITLYAGFDPTADSLHVGNLLQLTTLRRFQLAGHAPIVLAGGATGMIGDPGGRDSERSLLSPERLEENLAGIRPQLERFLDFSPAAGGAKALLVNNAEWLAPVTMLDFLRDVGKHFTVNQMIQKESVRSRIAREEQGISYTEFSYMLLQAADFLHLHRENRCDLQVGASDQWGNITAGIELVRRVTGDRVYALTTPLVLRADGAKFGKSESGALFLSADRTSPFEMYQYFVRVEDSMVPTYLRYFTFFSHAELLELDNALIEHPERRESQAALAKAVVDLVHGEAETARVVAASDALYSEDVVNFDEPTLLMVTGGAPSTPVARGELDGDGMDLVELLVVTGLVNSKGNARKMIDQGGIYLNNRRVDPAAARVGRGDLISDRYVVLRRGRRELHLVIFG